MTQTIRVKNNFSRGRIGLFALALLGITLSASTSKAACTYSDPVLAKNVDKTFASGSRWDFSVYRYACEGMVLTSVYFTPAGGTRRQVLATARLSQIHVPYLTGAPRYLDSTSATDGLGANAAPQSANECWGGELLDGGNVCVKYDNHFHGHAWKKGAGFRMRETVEVSMSSQLGQYNYMNLWEFNDDGSIDVRLGLSGDLQLLKDGSSYLPYGARVNAESAATPSVALGHWHSAYYRLDFDIDGSANDRVDRISFASSASASPDTTCAASGQCGKVSFTPITTETAQTWSSTAAYSWVVYDKSVTNADGRKIGYEVVPHVAAIHRGMTGTSEPYSGAEAWITKYNGCEVYAAENKAPHLPSWCTGNPENVSTMTNSESVDGQDLVLWYRASFLHVPRDEDQSPMPTEWIDFTIRPRNFHHINPAP